MELCNGGELFDHIVEAQHFTERKVRTTAGQQWQPMKQQQGLLDPTLAASCNRRSRPQQRCLHNAFYRMQGMHEWLQEQPIWQASLFFDSSRDGLRAAHQVRVSKQGRPASPVRLCLIAYAHHRYQHDQDVTCS
jgi:hypothetical protein